MRDKLMDIIIKTKDFDVIKSNIDNNLFLNYVISSSDTYLLKQFGNAILKYAFCESEEIRPCDICKECLKVANGNNIDIIRIASDTIIKKEEVVKMLEQSLIKPYEHNKKFLLIENGECLTEQTQNMLLKTMENMPSSQSLIILTNNDNLILPTIKSRAINIRLHNLRREDILSIFGTHEKILKIVDCFNNCIGDVTKFLEYKDFNVFYDFALSLLDDFISSSEMAKYSAVLVKYKDEFDDLILIVQGVFSLAMHGKIQSIYDAFVISKMIKVTMDAIKLKQEKVNFYMVVDKFLYELLKVKNNR